MEDGTDSNHLKPHILPPLGVSKVFNESGKIVSSNPHLDKPLRQRIGTPAPQKKSPIPDDLDLDNLDGKRGNPAIKVESCKSDDLQRNRYNILPEKTLKSLQEDFSRAGNNNLNCRFPKKLQLQPIMNPIFNMRNHGDLNGNEINASPNTSDLKITSPDVAASGKMRLPNKYTPLKPIARKKSDFD